MTHCHETISQQSGSPTLQGYVMVNIATSYKITQTWKELRQLLLSTYITAGPSFSIFTTSDTHQKKMDETQVHMTIQDLHEHHQTPSHTLS